jgi:UDP-N-acetylglucosamine diphosphorylase/glucosamine-1-phosphate N-acetyltransferase
MTNPAASARALYVYDDARARSFEPFALTRPAATLVAGSASVWERWQVALDRPAAGFVGCPRHADFDEADTPAVVVTGVIPAGSVIAHARFAPVQAPLATAANPETGAGVWTNDGRVAAVRLPRDLSVGDLDARDMTLDSLAPADAPRTEIGGWWHDAVWDYVRLLPEQLADDIRHLRDHPRWRDHIDGWSVPAHATVIGDHLVIIHGGGSGGEDDRPATIESHVVLDATAGPIYVGAGSHVHAFTRLVGPCYVGSSATVMGGDLSACSIGDVCKVRGEMSGTIMQPYSNKGHDGFVGHSYLGRWVNIGASTVTSNLKNTYGSVSLWTPEGTLDTGMQFLGTLFGDHVKTGIGLRLTTGCVLGAGANVYDRMPPKVVAPFSWGAGPPYVEYRLDKFLETAERMMARRQVPLSDRMRRHLTRAYADRWTAETDE